jgi:hypothetical protein
LTRGDIVRTRTAFLALLALAAPVGPSLAADAPLQADITVGMPRNDQSRGDFSAELDGGDALMIGRIRNREDGRTALVQLRFVYRIPPDTIALDEILDEIHLELHDRDGNRIAEAEIDPHETNLNPNGPTLSYRVTMYRPVSAYKLRVRVFGNYE